MSLLSWLLVTLAGLSLAVMVVSLSIANRSAREVRATIFPIVREEETVRMRRARITASVTGVVAAIMAGAFFLSGQLSSPVFPSQPAPAALVSLSISPTATLEVTSTPTEIPPSLMPEQVAPTQSVVVLITAQPLPSPGLPPPATSTAVAPAIVPTLSPSATSGVLPTSPTPVTSPVPAPTSVQLGPILFATQVTDRREAINPSSVFSETVSRVYAVFPYSGMRDGVKWAQVWYFNGIEFNRGEENWTWGSADRSYVFTRVVGAGNYRLELYVDGNLLASGNFLVEGPLAIGGPMTTQSSGTPGNRITSESLETPESQGTSESPGSP